MNPDISCASFIAHIGEVITVANPVFLAAF
jgi:hypothetical protein